MDDLIASNPIVDIEVVRSLVLALFRGSPEAGDLLARGLPADGKKLLAGSGVQPDPRVRKAASICLRRYGSGLPEHHAAGVWLVLRKHGVEPSTLPVLLEFDLRHPGGGSMVRALRRGGYDAADHLIMARTRETRAQVESLLTRLSWPTSFDSLSQTAIDAAIGYDAPFTEAFHVLKEIDLQPLLALPDGPVRDGIARAHIDLCRLRGRRQPVEELMRAFRSQRVFYPGVLRSILIATDAGTWSDDADWPERVAPMGTHGTGFQRSRRMDDLEVRDWVDAYAFGVQTDPDDPRNAEHLSTQLSTLLLDTLEQQGFYLWDDSVAEQRGCVLIVGRGVWGGALAMHFEVEQPDEDITVGPAV